jgi:hypothetical protein
LHYFHAKFHENLPSGSKAIIVLSDFLVFMHFKKTSVEEIQSGRKEEKMKYYKSREGFSCESTIHIAHPLNEYCK